jgi:hypothetical protein
MSSPSPSRRTRQIHFNLLISHSLIRSFTFFSKFADNFPLLAHTRSMIDMQTRIDAQTRTSPAPATATSSRLIAPGCWLLATVYWLPATGYWLRRSKINKEFK